MSATTSPPHPTSCLGITAGPPVCTSMANARRPGLSRAILGVVRRAAQAWAAWRALRRQAQELALLRELSPGTLEDIGAPPWLQQEAAAHRQAQALRRSYWRMGLEADGSRSG